MKVSDTVDVKFNKYSLVIWIQTYRIKGKSFADRESLRCSEKRLNFFFYAVAWNHKG